MNTGRIFRTISCVEENFVVLYGTVPTVHDVILKIKVFHQFSLNFHPHDFFTRSWHTREYRPLNTEESPWHIRREQIKEDRLYQSFSISLFGLNQVKI